VTHYYEHNGITIYHGDCRDILPHVTADVVVTDPPYGVAFAGKATKHTTAKTGGYIGVDDADVGPDVVTAAIACVGRVAVFTGNQRAFAYPPPDYIGCVFCPSGAGIGRWGFTLFHPVLFYGKRPSLALSPSSMQSFETSEQCGHPCPKPLGWMRWLIKLASNDGETILDPFMGSGTTLVAAKQLGRKAIGIEIEERYCEIAVKRLAQEVLPLEAEPEPAQQRLMDL